MSLIESGPNVAVLSSYHGDRVPAFQRAGKLFKSTNANLVHPPSFELVNPVDDEEVFVLREGDSGIPHHLLQLKEMHRMRILANEEPGQGFGYVVNEDGQIGMHTAGEMAYLAKHGVLNVASTEIEGFRGVPRYAQDTLRRTVQTVFPIDRINSENLEALQTHLSQLPRPEFNVGEKRILSRLVINALSQQRYEDKLHPVLLTSINPIKRAAFLTETRRAHPGRNILLDQIETPIPHIPQQPFQHQGIEGAQARIAYALEKTKGYKFKDVGSYENFIAALEPTNFSHDAWATPNTWASDDQIAFHPEKLVYADVACFVNFNMETGETITAYSKPVVIPSDVARETIRRGSDILYAQVLKEKDQKVDIHDPHSSLGTYTRRQQLLDVANAAFNL